MGKNKRKKVFLTKKSMCLSIFFLSLLILDSCHNRKQESIEDIIMTNYRILDTCDLSILDNIRITSDRIIDKKYVAHYYSINECSLTYVIPDFNNYYSLDRPPDNYFWDYGFNCLDLEDSLSVLRVVVPKSNKIFELFNNIHAYAIYGFHTLDDLIMFEIVENKVYMFYVEDSSSIQKGILNEKVLHSKKIDSHWSYYIEE